MTETMRKTAMRMMVGDTIPVEDKKAAHDVLAAFFEICGVVDADGIAGQITEKATRYAQDYSLRAVGFSDVIGMQTIHFVFETFEPDEPPFDFENEEGCFCYVYNLEAPFCSEYGYCGFRRCGEGLYRVS